MSNKEENRSDLEIIVRIKNKDGTTLENSVTMENAIPSADAFDLCTREGFLHDFDEVEKSVLKGSQQASQDAVKGLLDEVKKKSGGH